MFMDFKGTALLLWLTVVGIAIVLGLAGIGGAVFLAIIIPGLRIPLSSAFLAGCIVFLVPSTVQWILCHIKARGKTEAEQLANVKIA